MHYMTTISNIRRLAGLAMLLALGVSVGALDLPEVLERIDQTNEVRDAKAVLDLAQAELELAQFAGEISFGLQPGVTVSTPEGGPFADERLELLGIQVPAGLTAIREHRSGTLVENTIRG